MKEKRQTTTKDERIAEFEEQIKDLKDEVKFLKKKLSEKIEVSILGVTESKYAEIRHEICEKIRESFDEHRKILQSNYDECIFSMDDIIEKLEELDKIEQGDA